VIPAPHRRWIIVNAVLITAVLNAAISAGVAAAQAHGEHVVAWSLSPVKTTLLGNTVGTLFSLPLITTLLVSAAIRREQRLGTLPAISWPFASRPLSWIGVPGALRRGWRLGVLTFVALAPIDVVLVLVLGRHGTSPLHFALLQAAIGVALGALLTPLIALAAMCDDCIGS
jgi:hypothetical protein